MGFSGSLSGVARSVIKHVTKNLKIWGSIAYYKDKTTSLTKLELRAELGIVVRYNQYNYYILHLKLD